MPKNNNNKLNMTLKNLKATIIEDLDSYISSWKFSVLGHHHNERAQAVKSAISKATRFKQVRSIIDSQLALLDPTMRFILGDEDDKKHHKYLEQCVTTIGRLFNDPIWATALENRPVDLGQSTFYTIMLKAYQSVSRCYKEPRVKRKPALTTNRRLTRLQAKKLKEQQEEALRKQREEALEHQRTVRQNCQKAQSESIQRQVAIDRQAQEQRHREREIRKALLEERVEQFSSERKERLLESLGLTAVNDDEKHSEVPRVGESAISSKTMKGAGSYANLLHQLKDDKPIDDCTPPHSCIVPAIIEEIVYGFVSKIENNPYVRERNKQTFCKNDYRHFLYRGMPYIFDQHDVKNALASFINDSRYHSSNKSYLKYYRSQCIGAYLKNFAAFCSGINLLLHTGFVDLIPYADAQLITLHLRRIESCFEPLSYVISMFENFRNQVLSTEEDSTFNKMNFLYDLELLEGGVNQNSILFKELNKIEISPNNIEQCKQKLSVLVFTMAMTLRQLWEVVESATPLHSFEMYLYRCGWNEMYREIEHDDTSVESRAATKRSVDLDSSSEDIECEVRVKDLSEVQNLWQMVKIPMRYHLNDLVKEQEQAQEHCQTTTCSALIESREIECHV